jgi:hypothetical protein
MRMAKDAAHIKEVFDHWRSLDNDNLYLPEVKSRFFGLPEKMYIAARELDEYAKLLFLSQTVQMVLGGLRPATKWEVDTRLLAEYEKQGLIQTFDVETLARVYFEFFDIRVVLVKDDSVKKLYMYNPKLVERLHFLYEGITPYADQNIKLWIDENLSQGISKTVMKGLLYGVPVSSVKQYDTSMQSGSCRSYERHVVTSYGESYVVWGAYARDVRVREEQKDTFFRYLSDNELYRDFINELHHRAQPFRSLSMHSFLNIASSVKNHE